MSRLSNPARRPALGAALPFAAVALFGWALTGCNGGASLDLADVGPPPDGGTDGRVVDGGGDQRPAVTWYDDIEPIVQDRCISCHGPGSVGGVDLTLEWPEAAPGTDAPDPPWWAAAVVDSVESGSMPPWLPDPDCREVEGERLLSPAEVDLFRDWEASGFARGETRRPVLGPGPRPAPGPVDHVLDAGQGYVPRFDFNDDVRCLPLGEALAEPMYVQGVGVTPGEVLMVRRVRVFAVHPVHADQVAALDDESVGTGYPCYGGVGVPARQMLYAWTPDDDPMLLPAESAFVVDAGARLVMQVVYDARALDPTAPVAADQTTVSLWTLDAPPANRVETVDFARASLDIPAGEAEVEHSQSFPVGSEATIIGAVTTMHRLGARLEATVGGDDDACVVRVDRWSPAWAGTWLFPPDGWVPLQRGDALEVRCVHDNAAGSPGLAGRAPVDVVWGEERGDEQCAVALIVSRPFDQVVAAPQCGAFDGCVEACRDGDDGECFARCHAVGEQACSGCLLRATGSCGRSNCEPEVQALGDCTGACPEGGLGCIVDTCTDAFAELGACIDADLTTARCGQAYAGCGVRFSR